MTAAKKTKRKKLEKQSLTEFRAWLSGVEEMQDPGWIPNESQWELIRQRIDLIEEPQPVQTNHVHYNHNGQPDNPPQNGDPLIPQVPSAFDRVQVVAPTSSSLLEVPQARAAPAPMRRKPLVGSEKTPDIDSTTGYNSGFV